MCKVKRPFTLIELLICIFLITLVAVPLSRHPMVLFKKEITTLKELELDRFAELSFIEVLSKDMPKWDDMREAISFLLPEKTLEMAGINTFTFSPHVKISVARPKAEMNEAVRLMNCEIHFPGFKKKYSYKYLVEKQEICNDQ